MQRDAREPWERRPSGLFVPRIFHSESSSSSSETYFEIKEKAEAVKQLYIDNEVLLPVGCGLASLLRDTKRLSDAWFLDFYKNLTSETAFAIMHFNRIADVILSLKGIPGIAKYLDILTTGNLNLFERDRSIAKDLLWELELWTLLRASSFQATLAEPDIVIQFEQSNIGIACKKLYSEKHVQHVLSEAAAQIERTCKFGIVALNIDDLRPANQFIRASTIEIAGHFVTAENNRFLIRHERHFRKYLASGRLLCALVSTALVADIPNVVPRLNNMRRSTIWTIPGLPPNKEAQLRMFYSRLVT